MKKILFILILFLPLVCLQNFSIASADEVYYAKINSESAFLYSSPNEENSLFLLPKTYFVKLINEANKDYYFCSYKDIKGYVKKNDVLAMNGLPSQPYLDGLFRTFSLDGLGLYSSPSYSQENLLATIPYLTDNLVFYGEIQGQELVPEKGKKWIYCKYSDQNIFGYVYSVFCDKLPSFTQNYETFETIENPFEKTSIAKELSPVAMGFIIAGVTIPCVIVLFLLIKPTLNKEKLNNLKPKFKAKRNRDYFEFDDSDLN